MKKTHNNMYFYENSYYDKGFKQIAGIDEAGRGCLAGPLVVAICILPKKYHNDEIIDSKQLTSKKRDVLYDEIIAKAIYYSLEFVSATDVDKYNVKGATKRAMVHLLESATIEPDICLIDAEKIETNLKTHSIIKGDCNSITIAAASILAKVSRDRYMIELDKKHPNYKFKKNKGYGTNDHLIALKKFGLIAEHRLTFDPVKNIKNSSTDKS
jgi:ribonuclease HII